MNIYFAGAIRGGREDTALYLEIIRQLREYGRVLTEHVGDARLAATGEAADDGAIHDRDLAWLRESEYIVAEVTTPSLGVGYELGKATEWGKPTLCLFRPGGGRALSAMITGSDGVTVRRYQSAAELREIFEGFFGTPRSVEKVTLSQRRATSDNGTHPTASRYRPSAPRTHIFPRAPPALRNPDRWQVAAGGAGRQAARHKN